MKEYLMDAAQILDIVREAVGRGQSIVLSGTGTSMQPTIRDGERVVLAPLPRRRPKAGDLYLYRRANGQAVIHRVMRVHKSCCDMRGDGQAWLERDVPNDSLVAFVTQILRSDGAYRCDCASARLWARLRPARRFAAHIRQKLFKR